MIDARPDIIHTVAAHEKVRVAPTAWPGWLVCAALMLLALVFRVVLMTTVYPYVDSDEAIIGLMAYHIGAGDRPLLYYGQPYQGSLEAYLAALAFRLWGAGDFTLRLPALAFSVGFVGAAYALGATLYGRRNAILSALFVALGPGLLIFHSTAAGYGYIEVMVCGAILLPLAARYPDPRTVPFLTTLAVGLLAGFGVWMEPLMAEYLAPLALAYLLPLIAAWRATSVAGWLRALRALAVAAVGTLVGAAPLLLYNLNNHNATLAYLYRNGRGGDHLAVAVHLVTQALPIVLGLAIPHSGPDVATQLANDHLASYLIGLVGGAYILGRFSLGPRGLLPRIASLMRRQNTGQDVFSTSAHVHRRVTAEPALPTSYRDGALALFALSCLLFFVLSRFGAEESSTSLPRYLLPLYTATPLIVDMLVPRVSGRRATGIALLSVGLLCVAGLTLTMDSPGNERAQRPIAGLIRALQEDGVRAAYTNYWVAYRLSFESQERIVGLPVNGPRLARMRIPGDLAAATRLPANHLAWIVYRDSPDERAFRHWLRRTHTRAHRVVWEGLVVYDHLSRPLRAVGPAQQ